jgi:hypothetical protein
MVSRQRSRQSFETKAKLKPASHCAEPVRGDVSRDLDESE